MAQKFSDAARATLVSGIAAGDTSLTLNSGNAFPVANTGTSMISESADWFKLVLQDATKFEIVYARTHAANASVISDLLRGQEGTTASAFAATSVVGLRQTAMDAVQYAATKVALESHVGSGGAAHADATGSVGGFMSAADKTKLDGVAAGATNYAHPANHPASIITQDSSNRFVTDTEKATWNAKQAAGNYATGGGTATGTNTGDQVLPTTLPASDVYAWAKATTKPSYTATEVGLGNVPNLAFSGSNTGDETTATIKTKLGVTTLSGSNTGDQTIPATLPNANAVTFNTTGGAVAGSNYTGAAVLTVDYATVGAAAAGHTHSYQAADADLLAIGGLVGNSGYLKKTAADTWTLDTATFATGSGTATGTNTGDQVIPTTLPASDVYAWAKAATKPTYSATEVGLGNVPNLAFSGSNTGDETTATIKTKLGITTLSGANTGDQTIPTTLPASDVYAWAKAATKPSYTAAEVGAQVAGTYATGTGSASGVNTGDQNLSAYATKAGVETLTNKTITETVFAVTGTTPALTATNGAVQTWTLTAASTPTNSLTTGQSIILVITPGAFAITWPSVVWTKQGGSGAAPTLFSAGKTSVVLWMVGAVLYGSHLGDTV